MTFSLHDQEVIVANAAWQMIDDMVNHAIFVPLGTKTDNTNLLPQSQDTLRLFNVLIADFLSPLVRKGKNSLPFSLPSAPSNARSSDLTFLFYLRRIVDAPQLGGDTENLRDAVESFSLWLEGNSSVEKVWFPSVELELDLTIERRIWIKICGDIAKHSFVRLEPNVGKIVRIISEHGKSIDAGQAYLILPEFWDWFHTHLFAYHASTLAEFLNNIRWELYGYLQPEFQRAYRREENSIEYTYDVPPAFQHPLAKAMYWEMMNNCRSEPWFPRFSVTESLKTQF